MVQKEVESIQLEHATLAAVAKEQHCKIQETYKAANRAHDAQKTKEGKERAAAAENTVANNTEKRVPSKKRGRPPAAKTINITTNVNSGYAEDTTVMRVGFREIIIGT